MVIAVATHVTHLALAELTAAVTVTVAAANLKDKEKAGGGLLPPAFLGIRVKNTNKGAIPLGEAVLQGG